ncbi:MAG: siderophore-interacting protein, partial [Hydrogenophaga sp.]|nr:siderophore-interacting protein [Hydrogenophaga sp.]
MTTSTHSPLAVERVRHPIQVRRLQVQRIDRIGANFLRIR